MTQISYVEFGGTQHSVDVPNGHSLMNGALDNGISGIDAECGGACSCATCHVYIGREWADRLPAVSETEAELLDFAEDRNEDSRLACQILVHDSLSGLVVRMPRNQG